MNDPETFLLEVYVVVDDLIDPLLAAMPPRPGPAPALSPSEVITLVLMSHWARFRSGRDFYRYAESRLRPLFPTLPHRTQFVPQMLRLHEQIAWFVIVLADQLAQGSYEVIDSTAVPLRNRHRRGRGWVPDVRKIGSSSRMKWYDGVHLCTCSDPCGVVTGYGIASGNVNDRTMADTFFAIRAGVLPSLPGTGHPLSGDYLADMGFGGKDCEARWRVDAQAKVICAPQPDRKPRRWPKELRQWLATRRQVIESVFARLFTAFRLDAIRPHSLPGLLATIAAIMALHTLTILLNRRHERPDLSWVHTLGW